VVNLRPDGDHPGRAHVVADLHGWPRSCGGSPPTSMSWPAPAAWPTSARPRPSLTGGPNGGAGSPSRTWTSGSSAAAASCPGPSAPGTCSPQSAAGGRNRYPLLYGGVQPVPAPPAGAVRMIPCRSPRVFSKLDGLTRFLAPFLPAPRFNYGRLTRKGILWYFPTPKLGLFYLDDGAWADADDLDAAAELGRLAELGPPFVVSGLPALGGAEPIPGQLALPGLELPAGDIDRFPAGGIEGGPRCRAWSFPRRMPGPGTTGKPMTTRNWPRWPRSCAGSTRTAR
jgi:hypothetical protein